MPPRLQRAFDWAATLCHAIIAIAIMRMTRSVAIGDGTSDLLISIRVVLNAGPTEAGMIQPAIARVRPRVNAPEIGGATPLADLLLECPGSPARVIEIVGGPGSGKSTALAHLAATFPANHNLILLDDATPAAINAVMGVATVVFTSQRPCSLPGAVSYPLAPWGNDELVEYLLAAHPARCRSVMTRLQASPDRRLPNGVPEIWQIILDRMAQDESLTTVSAALWQQLHEGLPAAYLLTGAEQYGLAELTGRAKMANKCYRGLQRLHVNMRTLNLLRHAPVRLMLASDRLARLLETRSGCKWLKQRLPRDLVKAAAAGASSSARRNLSGWTTGWRKACQAMAASLLHAIDAQWTPKRESLPLLSGAYLDEAAWRGVDLGGARLVGADLSGSDLAEAILDRAIAMSASFRNATLHGASLVKLQARAANLELAVLTAIDARSAVLCDALLAEADLTNARLPNADLHGANLADARLCHADLTSVRMTEALIDGADFSGANLSCACLNGLRLRKANFSGTCFANALLMDCDLEGMELPGANFAGAHLQGALLTASRMPHASFAGARLQNAGLADVEWENVDLRNADMRGCTFHLGSSRSGLVDSTIACEGSRTGFYGDEFDQQTYRAPEEIRKANLCGADLRNANLRRTDFYLVDLRRAKYTPDQLEHLRRCGAILFDRK